MKKFVLSTLCASLAFALNVQAAPVSGINQANFDKSVRAEDDLFRAVNGHWLKSFEIPADKSNYGAFNALDDLSTERVKTIIEQLGKKDSAAGSDAQKIGDFYKSFMNEAQIEKLGLQPLQAELDAIEALKSKEAVAAQFGKLQQLGVATPIALYVGQDDKKSTEYIVNLYQYGTGLPDRDYYLKDDKKFAEVRAAYEAYIAHVLRLSGEKDAARAAKAILALETKLAKAQWTKVELRDPQKTYNKLSITELEKAAPGFDWQGFFAAAGVKDLKSVNVVTPSFFTGMSAVFKDSDVSLWREYLRFKLLDGYGEYLPKAYADAHFAFHGKTLGGIPEQKPRWKKAVDTINGSLGELTGKLYVEQYFPAEAKTRMEGLVKNLMVAFEKSIGELTWMSEQTQAKAKEKLSKFRPKIGYPSKWRDYSALAVKDDALVANLMASGAFEYAHMLNKLGKPIDREEWGMTPQTVNAYYSPSMNEIVFPAAILQPPFFNLKADDAVNYGGIGAVIGHEISHGFDDQGSQYDGDGNLKNWWSDADSKAFKKLTERLVAQYAAYEPLPGKPINGELTLGENIADLSGLAVAYKAYKLSLNGKEAPVIDGLTGDQRFFMGWSQVWARKYREPEMLKRLLTDPHSPSEYRTNGIVTNSDAFHQAFDVKKGDKLYKPESDRIKIW